MSTPPTGDAPLFTLQAFLDALPDAALLLDRVGAVVTSNAAWRELAAEASSGAAGPSSPPASPADGLFLPQIAAWIPGAALDEGTLAEGFRAMIADERLRWDVDHVYQHHGEARCWSLTLSQLRLGGMEGVLVQARRATGPLLRLQAEAELRDAKGRFERMMAVTREAIILSDQGRIVDANPAVLGMFGYTPEQMIGMDGMVFVAPELRETTRQRLLEDNPVPSLRQSTFLRRDGSSFDAEVFGTAVPYQGRWIHGHAVRDVTERKRAIRAAQESEERFRLFADMTSEAMLITENGIVLDINRAMTERFGISKEDIVGKSVTERVIPEYRTQMGQAIATHPEEDETVVVHKDGSSVPVRVTGQLLPYQGRLVRCTTLHDLTLERQAEAALRLRLAQEEKLSAQAAVLAALSTPLIPISDRVVVMPLIGALDEHRGARAMEILLGGIQQNGATIAILDITGVPTVDARVADGLVRAARAARLVGAQVVLTGIRAEVAQTLVELGADLSGIVTCGTLKSGIAYAMGRRHDG